MKTIQIDVKLGDGTNVCVAVTNDGVNEDWEAAATLRLAGDDDLFGPLSKPLEVVSVVVTDDDEDEA